MPVAAFLRMHHGLGGVRLSIGEFRLLAVVPLLNWP